MLKLKEWNALYIALSQEKYPHNLMKNIYELNGNVSPKVISNYLQVINHFTYKFHNIPHFNIYDFSCPSTANLISDEDFIARSLCAALYHFKVSISILLCMARISFRCHCTRELHQT